MKLRTSEKIAAIGFTLDLIGVAAAPFLLIGLHIGWDVQTAVLVWIALIAVASCLIAGGIIIEVITECLK